MIPVDATIVRQALDAGFPDFEDALQYFAAASILAVEPITTRDPKGFRASSLPVLTLPESVTQLP